MMLHEPDNPAASGDFQLCSAEFIRFMRAVSGSFQNGQELIAALKREFPLLAKALNIGYFVILLSAPQNLLVPEGIHYESILFGDPDGANMNQKVQMVFQSSDNGTFTVIAAPASGVTWTSAIQDQVHFLGETLFLLSGRSRVDELLHIAISTDFLTGVMNVPGMLQYGKQLQAMGWLQNYVSIFLNIKNFKYINETVGQPSGDQILISYCRSIQAQLQPDERIARPGGDNFLLLVRKENAARILTMLKELPVMVTINGMERIFTLSAHVGAYDIHPDDSVETVFNNASIALNSIRYTGNAEDQLWYQPSMHEKMMHEKFISHLFAPAIKNGEFIVYYQPKVTLETRELCGCEALCRWRHDGKIVPPMEFIPVFEKEGTVCELDFYVFECVCRDIRDWLDKGIEPVRVSVNFSQQHLHDERLAQKIINIMKKYNIDSQYIEVELTEMSGVKNYDAMIEFLSQMRDSGICTSIDDFGTGYSSLNMLREFQMDIIKLDKSFLDRISADNSDHKTDEIIVENIVRMAQSLNLEIISEGVETCQQADFLKSIHCNMAQGYLFDKPLPHDEFETRLLGGRVYPN